VPAAAGGSAAEFSSAAEPAQDAPATALTPMQRARQQVAREGGARRTGLSAAPADDSAASDDDEDIQDVGGVGLPVIQSVLGGTVIGEFDQ
jgi:DNA polymerase-3 subunit gamma/tau